MHGDIGNIGWLWMGLMPILWLGLPALIAWIVWTATRPRHDLTTPLDLLRERYARGEISREQFDQATKDLA